MGRLLNELLPVREDPRIRNVRMASLAVPRRPRYRAVDQGGDPCAESSTRLVVGGTAVSCETVDSCGVDGAARRAGRERTDPRAANGGQEVPRRRP